jgi:ferrous iron transport protein B
MLFAIYGIGILLAVLIARLFKRFIFKHDEVPFVMELPPYRIPTLKNTIRHMWHKGAEYLKKMGGIILVASIIIWFLSYFPQHVDYSEDFDAQIEQLNSQYSSLINNSSEELAQLYQNELAFKTDSIELVKKGEHQSNTYIGRLGKSIEPVIKPLGFDWKMGVSLITGIAAKEIVVSTMAVIYHSDDDTEESSKLISQIQNEKYTDGSPVFNKISAFGFMLFILIYFPCVAVIAAIRKESGEWKWALFTIVYTTSLAWIVAFSVNQIGHLLF